MSVSVSKRNMEFVTNSFSSTVKARYLEALELYENYKTGTFVDGFHIPVNGNIYVDEDTLGEIWFYEENQWFMIRSKDCGLADQKDHTWRQVFSDYGQIMMFNK